MTELKEFFLTKVKVDAQFVDKLVQRCNDNFISSVEDLSRINQDDLKTTFGPLVGPQIFNALQPTQTVATTPATTPATTTTTTTTTTSELSSQVKEIVAKISSEIGQDGLKILVFVDSTPQAEKAFRKALLMRRPQDFVLIVNVVEDTLEGVSKISPSIILSDPKFFESITKAKKDAGAKISAEYTEKCRKEGVEHFHAAVVHTKGPTETSQFIADVGTNIVFVGTRGLTGFHHMMSGSFSNYILHHTTCDVIIVKK